MSMDPDEALLLDALLAEQQAGMRLDTARLEASLVELLRDRADGTADDEHDPEGTPLSAEWSRMAGVRDALARTSRELDAARARLGAGAYGDCASCGRPIGAARLAARPTAELCIDCARRAESRTR
ncbi:molecular chaperone DnaK [Rathayibacter rathayi]|uniref:Molecular chaperone DnaK n=2 Tax=Rathayibacter rathayi TaxID=33887 RepID=A0ABD6WAT0_RATRA|nr:TraR/DksA C4-type zinc finger protein [Rathayibacter rathayi]AZZ47884.1 molecular chaperone DnaK [Rathayibacter rathayi]MWV75149.1 molecular chaperone DnaK [Rathayibacter rathayi NCPPB 2980 = VKM Ac-1601]PPF15532.1 molecular chaperone DnaK [Rathayibacter rathayi]PPF51326.1 molecular chaperone DnaK [Rathayibacter rathayi]PPF79362.1 molecular chaperone DnaK [Rathayibacter rathayi]